VNEPLLRLQRLLREERNPNKKTSNPMHAHGGNQNPHHPSQEQQSSGVREPPPHTAAAAAARSRPDGCIIPTVNPIEPGFALGWVFTELAAQTACTNPRGWPSRPPGPS